MADSVVDEATVVETVQALEAADEPLDPREWPALVDRRLRQAVGQRLAGLGRQLVEVTHGGGGPLVGYLSTWSDEAAVAIAGDEVGLPTEDLAVLTLVYLHTAVLAGLLGEEVPELQEQLDAHEGPDGRDVVSGSQLSESLSRLRSRQLLDARNRPGPALRRLSPAQRRRLEENLVLLCRPDSIWASEIRTGRHLAASSGAE